jgi:protocatechuate 3,4-dioxygenase alpha subunit
MTVKPELIPCGSQTVGPYYRIGLDYLAERAPKLLPGSPGVVEIRGQVLDRDGVPVPDALLEFWSADTSRAETRAAGIEAFPSGFHRVATDSNGRFSVAVAKPGPVPLGDGSMQAPHMLVLVFARGLLRHLITRVYFDGESANASDPVLLTIPVERQGTLVVRQSAADAIVFEWNVILQGEKETVFFAW